MHAHTDPHTSPCLSNSRFTCAGSMCDVSSTGISTAAKPHFLKVGKSFVLSLVNGEVNRNVFMPNLIKEFLRQARGMRVAVKSFQRSMRNYDLAGSCAGL